MTKKTIIISAVALVVVIAGFFGIKAMTGKGSNEEQKTKFDKLVLVAKQINAALESEVAEGKTIIDGKPAVGTDKSSVTTLEALLDSYEKQKLAIPEAKNYSAKEQASHIEALEKAIKLLDAELLNNLKLDSTNIEALEKTLADEEAFNNAFSENGTIKILYNGLKTQVNKINEAVKAETKRVSDEKAAKAKKEKEALAKKKAQCAKDYGWWENGKCVYGGMGKPVLYLYPTKPTKVEVKFQTPELLTTTYPKFPGVWKVTAYPNGALYDENNKYYYALYWEEDLIRKIDFKTGFYVEKQEAIKFLEEKLSTIGLNARESNEFIMYWLPILEKNEKSLVYFELTKEKQEDNELIISPKPDSLLRVTIHVKKVKQKTTIKKQELTPFKRIGFAAIEWGGINY